MVISMEGCRNNLMVIIDGHAYAHRAFHAISSLSSPDGLPTNAIYGFIRALDKIIERFKPTHLLVVWDGGLDNERKASLPEYKENRPPMPGSLETQIGLILEYLEKAHIPYFYRQGVEADDWIATVAVKASTCGMNVIIASMDKDFMQLVSDKIGLFNPADKSEKIWTEKDVMEKTGVEPMRIVDLLSLVGDDVDNIPGVDGIGPKTAAALLNKFDSIEGIYNNINNVTPDRLRSKLIESKDVVMRNRDLIRLYTALPFEFNLEDYRLKDRDEDALREFYRRLGFKSLLNENRKNSLQGCFAFDTEKIIV
ncbi:MAG: 5'-3' exonuclease [Verrucomicrobiae bacterium]|nr:5'-3' exonuclease [Verrucomicrobiae bacterium]